VSKVIKTIQNQLNRVNNDIEYEERIRLGILEELQGNESRLKSLKEERDELTTFLAENDPPHLEQ
jgi:archaellum component FlaC